MAARARVGGDGIEMEEEEEEEEEKEEEGAVLAPTPRQFPTAWGDADRAEVRVGDDFAKYCLEYDAC